LTFALSDFQEIGQWFRLLLIVTVKKWAGKQRRLLFLCGLEATLAFSPPGSATHPFRSPSG
jgi:hypothetical protein